MNSVLRCPVKFLRGYSTSGLMCKKQILLTCECICKRKRFSSSIFKNPFQKPENISSSNDTRESSSSLLVGRDFLSLQDFGKDEIHQFLWAAKDLKIRMQDGGEPCQLLQGKTAVLCFDKEDPATQLSAEQGISKLGGHAAHYHTDGINNVKNAGWLLSGLSDLILMSGNHQDMKEMADVSHVPVVDGLSNLLQPLQVLTYFMTIQENFGYLRGAKIAYVGKGGAMLNSLLYGCGRLGIDLNTATPPGSEPDFDVMLNATKMANKNGATFQLGDDPLKAVYRADVIITASGQTEERTDPRYQVNRKMLREAGGSWIFLHDPNPRSARINDVTDDILYGEESLVRQAMENKLWTTMSVLLNLLVPYQPIIDKPKYVRG